MDDEEEEYYDIQDHPKYALGDIVTFTPPSYIVEFQGRIMSMYAKDSEYSEIFFLVMILKRPGEDFDADDFNGRNHHIFEYWERNELIEISANWVLGLVLSEIVDGPVSLDHFTALVKSAILRKGFIYISGCEESEYDAQFVDAKSYPKGTLAREGFPPVYPPCPAEITLHWHHFDPVTTNIDFGQFQFASVKFWVHVKEHIFDPLVNPRSFSHRRAGIHRNYNLWVYLLQNSHLTYEQIETELQNHPHVRNHPQKKIIHDYSLLDTEPMLAPDLTIPFITEHINLIKARPNMCAARIFFALKQWQEVLIDGDLIKRIEKRARKEREQEYIVKHTVKQEEPAVQIVEMEGIQEAPLEDDFIEEDSVHSSDLSDQTSYMSESEESEDDSVKKVKLDIPDDFGSEASDDEFEPGILEKDEEMKELIY